MQNDSLADVANGGKVKEESKKESEPINCAPEDDDEGAQLIGNDFLSKGTGVYEKTKTGNLVLLCSPCIPEAYVRDESGIGWCKQFTITDRRGFKRPWVLKTEDLIGGSQHAKEFVTHGGKIYNITPDGIKSFANYLNAAEPKKYMKKVAVPGWHNNCYIHPDRCIGTLEDDQLVYDGGNFKGIQVKGTVEDWKKHIGVRCIDNSRMILMVNAAFEAPMRGLLEPAKSIGYHYRGGSGDGKTTTMRIGESVYGSSDIESNWDATVIGLQIESVERQHFIYPIDEAKQADLKDIDKVAFTILNGRTRGRGERSGEKAKKRIQTCLVAMSTGEHSFEELARSVGKQTDVGIEARFIDIPVDAGKRLGAFENLHSSTSGAEFSDLLQELRSKYYGAVGLAFIENIAADINFALDFVKKKIETFLLAHVATDAHGQIHRTAKDFAINAACGSLATHYGLTGWGADDAELGALTCFHAWQGNRGGTGALEKHRALSQVRLFLAKHDSRFPSLTVHNELEKDHLVTPNRAGFQTGMQSQIHEFWIFPEIFKTEVCQGFDEKRVKAWLKEEEFLVTQPEKKKNKTLIYRTECTKRVPGFPDPTRMVVVKKAIFGSVDT